MGIGSSSSLPPLKVTNKPVDVMKMMGKWYVIGVKPTYFETGATNAIENYSWNEKQQRIDVDFKFNYKTFDGPVKSIPQKGFLYKKATANNPDNVENAEWRVQAFPLIKLPYLILEVDHDNYSYVVVGYPNRAYAWLMARTPAVSDEFYDGVVDRLKNQHQYDMNGWFKVPQQEASAEAK